MSQAKKSAMGYVKPALVILGVSVFIYFYPRFLVSLLGEDNPWTSYFYLYGFGLLYFGSGMWLIRATGACVPGRGRDRFWWNALLLGFAFFAGLHAIWIYLSLSIPYLGGQ